MGPAVRTGSPTRGFSLIELLVVLALVALLAAIVAPTSGSSVARAKEAALREDLYVLRKAIDDFYADKGSYPTQLDQLVEARYLRSIPPDPISGEAWIVQRDTTGQGIADVQSSAPGISAAGTP